MSHILDVSENVLDSETVAAAMKPSAYWDSCGRLQQEVTQVDRLWEAQQRQCPGQTI